MKIPRTSSFVWYFVLQCCNVSGVFLSIEFCHQWSEMSNKLTDYQLIQWDPAGQSKSLTMPKRGATMSPQQESATLWPIPPLWNSKLGCPNNAGCRPELRQSNSGNNVKRRDGTMSECASYHCELCLNIPKCNLPETTQYHPLQVWRFPIWVNYAHIQTHPYDNSPKFDISVCYYILVLLYSLTIRIG